ncbi:MAG: YdjY domain-containing protein [Planctomycetota bacterium]
MGRKQQRLFAFFVLLVLMGFDPRAHAQSPDDPRSSARSPNADVDREKLHPFATGVVIDWSRKTVEVESAVVLREGPLELFACSPRTREHESIITIQARPLHVFQAMGLVGLEPGQPLRHDREKDTWLPPTGESISIRVRYGNDGIDFTVPIERWMVDAKTGLPSPALPWVFAGSTMLPDGVLGADVEGTVVSVVDFETAIIALTKLHTSANEQLWLKANTTAIPPIKSKCTMLIQRGTRDPNVKPLTLVLSEKGSLSERTSPDEGGAVILDLEGWAKTIRTNLERPWFIEVSRGVTNDVIKSTLSGFKKAGFDRRDVELRPVEEVSRGVADGMTSTVPRP